MANFALIVGKIVAFILGLFNRGSALPGKIALRLEPDILSHFKFPNKIIAVTGTNGKTSTTRYISAIFEKAGYKVVSNFKGANLHQGIVTELVNSSSANLKVKADVLVLEIDEMTLVNLYDVLKPTELVMTNLFPDQADRFGSVEELAAKMNDSLTSETKLILNANDPSLVWIGNSHPTFDKVYYGLAEQDFDQPTHTVNCPNCSEPLSYSHQFYEHIGYFNCGNCGLKTPEIEVLGNKVSIEGQSFNVSNTPITVPQANLYSVFNTLATVTVAKEYNIDVPIINQALKTVKTIKGRNDNLSVDGKNIYVNMAKNPAGMNQSISTVLSQVEGPYSLVLSANNNRADGVSIEWFNACSFNRLNNENLENIYVSGMVSSELADVLIGQGIPKPKIKTIESKDAIDLLVNDSKADQHFILANYTALDDLYAAL